MGIVNGNPMGMGISMVAEWEWEWLYGNGREWESERHSRTPLVRTPNLGEGEALGGRRWYVRKSEGEFL